jgi:hypothetical protein
MLVYCRVQCVSLYYCYVLYYAVHRLYVAYRAEKYVFCQTYTLHAGQIPPKCRYTVVFSTTTTKLELRGSTLQKCTFQHE